MSKASLGSRKAEGEPGVRPVIQTFRAFLEYMREDYEANNRGFWEPGFQTLAAYRMETWCNGIGNRLLRIPVRVLSRLLLLFCRNFYGIELHGGTHIGRRLRIAHQNGIVIHPKAVIGDDCIIRHGVTIGAVGKGGGRGNWAPKLGDRVEVGVGAVLTGRITVGDDSSIGPNAVVMTNVPAGSIVAAPPARIMTPPPRKDA